jgi:hypothetical protein
VTGITEFEDGDDLECGGCGRILRVDPIEYDRGHIGMNDNVHIRVRFD